MSLADWLVVSVTVHYVLIGFLYAYQQNQPLLLGLYGCYAGANVFLILMAQKVARSLPQ
jgi:hypothetical protein